MTGSDVVLEYHYAIDTALPVRRGALLRVRAR
jgi:hypothetical protein